MVAAGKERRIRGKGNALSFLFRISRVKKGTRYYAKLKMRFCVKSTKDSFPPMPNENASLGTAAKANPFGYPASL